MWATVIRFWVNVPVLSEQMVLVEPNVSTASKFLTKQFLLAILSMGFSSVQSALRVCGSDSPVNDEFDSPVNDELST
uniref:Uncharacterized protein n=1 Tax=Romanomermis culicivorax TaxID=13658 RepID=A0A915KE57_ROMCU